MQNLHILFMFRNCAQHHTYMYRTCSTYSVTVLSQAFRPQVFVGFIGHRMNDPSDDSEVPDASQFELRTVSKNQRREKEVRKEPPKPSACTALVPIGSGTTVAPVGIAVGDSKIRFVIARNILRVFGASPLPGWCISNFVCGREQLLRMRLRQSR